METNLTPIKKTARTAGVLYFIWVMTACYSLMYVVPKTITQGDALSTANKMRSHEFLFYTGIANDVFSSAICVFMVLALYRLLRHVNESYARLMVTLLILTIPVAFISDAFSIAAINMFKGEVLKTFELSQRQDFGMLFLKMNDYGSIIVEMFWGLWLLPFGLLVYKSGFIPRILGIFLILNGITYIIHCLTHLLLPGYQTLVFQFSMPFWILGEISITLWLLNKGVKSSYECKESQWPEKT